MTKTKEKHEPIAYYRADGFGEMVYRSNNTVDVRKNDYDFPKGLIKGLYSEDYVNQLKNQNEISKIFFQNILDVNPNIRIGSPSHLANCVHVMKNSAENALKRLEKVEND